MAVRDPFHEIGGLVLTAESKRACRRAVLACGNGVYRKLEGNGVRRF